MVFAEVREVGVNVLAVVECGVVLRGDKEQGVVFGVEFAEWAFFGAEVLVIAERFLVVNEAVDGDDLRCVGEERRIDFIARVGVVLCVEVGEPVLEFCGLYTPVVNDDDYVVLLTFTVAEDTCLRR